MNQRMRLAREERRGREKSRSRDIIHPRHLIVIMRRKTGKSAKKRNARRKKRHLRSWSKRDLSLMMMALKWLLLKRRGAGVVNDTLISLYF